MTIIFYGNGWHAEMIKLTVTIQDAAGNYNSNIVNVEKPGAILAGFVTPRFFVANNNSQAIGETILQVNSATLDVGDQCDNVRAIVIKAVGTAGDTINTLNAVVFIRDSN